MDPRTASEDGATVHTSAPPRKYPTTARATMRARRAEVLARVEQVGSQTAVAAEMGISRQAVSLLVKRARQEAEALKESAT